MVGYMGAFIITLVMMGIFSLIYIGLDQAHTILLNFADNNIDTAAAQNTVAILEISWIYFPLAVLFSYVVWSISKPRKEKERFR